MADDFFRTKMGRKFYEADIPKIVSSLDRIADSLVIITEHLSKPKSQPKPKKETTLPEVIIDEHHE